MATATEANLPWFTAGDVDGFFGLFFSGFPDLLLIVGLAPVCGFPLSFVASRILPGAAISILAGNLFYAWQARRLARREGRSDVTAIPFGINTPTIFAYVFLIMGPIYTRTHDANLAWHAGIFASMMSGIVQTVGASCTDWLRRNTPRAALALPAGRPCACLSLPGLRLRRLSAGGHRSAPHAGPLHPLRLASQTPLSCAAGFLCHRSRRGVGGSAALAPHLYPSDTRAAGGETLSAPRGEYICPLHTSVPIGPISPSLFLWPRWIPWDR